MKFVDKKMHCLREKLLLSSSSSSSSASLISSESVANLSPEIKIEPIDSELINNNIGEENYDINHHHHHYQHKHLKHSHHLHHNQPQHNNFNYNQQSQKIILSPRVDYYHQNHHHHHQRSSFNKHNQITTSGTRDLNNHYNNEHNFPHHLHPHHQQSIEIESPRKRCNRSPIPTNMSSNPKIGITRASQSQQNTSTQSNNYPATSSSTPSTIQHGQHLQQVRVIRDGRLYEESRRSPPTLSSASGVVVSHPQQKQQQQQQQPPNHLHHNLHGDNNLRILSVAAVEAAEKQAAAEAAARKHSNNCSGNNRHTINNNQKSDNCNYIISPPNSKTLQQSSNFSNGGGGNDMGVVFRTPIVSSSSCSSTSSKHSSNNSSTSMRPPPPPPPPKLKSQSNGGGCNKSIAISSSSSSSSSVVVNSSSSNQPTSTTTVPTNASIGASNSVNEEPSSSIPDLEFDGTTVLCRVCGDKASGFHYGVHSCEGCKGFFRRSIQQKIQYRPCTKNQQCSILRINRNRCQYCRLKKCIAVGMSRDAVRFGRVPKREKARILAAMQQSTQNRGQQRQLATELDDQPRLLAAVLRAHMETCEFTKEKVTAMRQRARECPSYSMPTLLACPLNPAPELQSEQEFSERFAHVIRGVIDFAGMIPGFQLLNQDDKFTLLKAGLFDALFVRLICMFDSSINSIICLNGQVMRRDAIQNGANARFLVDSTFNFAERMNSMNLTDAEIGLFCAIVLITPDRPGLRNIELIDKMYSRLKACLQTIINQNRPDQPEFLTELLKTMPDLRTLSTLHTEKLVVFRTEHKELLRQQMWQMDDDQPSKSPGSSWDDRDRLIDDVAKSPLGSVSSTESGDIEYQHHHHHLGHHHNHNNNNNNINNNSSHNNHHLNHNLHNQTQTAPSSLASSAPLLAATLSGTCPLRNRANSGSSAEDVDIVGSHAHLTQNGLTITPVARSSQLLHHHLNGQRHPYRKLDSPTDSGIESGNEKAESTKTVSSGGGSSCSSPRSCVDDAMDTETTTTTTTIGSNQAQQQQQTTIQHHHSHHMNNSNHLHHHHHHHQQQQQLQQQQNANNQSIVNGGATKRQIVEDMPVLKRVLQAPPLYDTNSLMDEAYKPHKKFRALRHRDYDASEADATTTTTTTTTSSTTNNNSAMTPVSQMTNGPANINNSNSNSSCSMNNINNNCSSKNTNVPQVNHQQSQLHMHLTRNTNTNTVCKTGSINNSASSGNNYSVHVNNQTTQQQQQQQQPPPQQQQQHSTLSSTHSVLAKSLMAEPRMTPEQMKRSDIIQNYIMRDQPSQQVNSSSSSSSSGTSNNGLLVCAANGNSNCASPSTTTVTLASPPPPPPTSARWQGHSVITTTTLRQQSVSPHSSNSSTASCNSNGSSSNSSSTYFQAPHSTSVSPPRPSPSALSPRLLELQVDIADSQQPLNLSKKSPSPPPSSPQQQQQQQQKLMVVAHNKILPSVGADVTVTPSTKNVVGPTTTTIHKVLLET